MNKKSQNNRMNASAVKTLLENFLKIARALRRAQFKIFFAYRELEGYPSAKQSRHINKVIGIVIVDS